MSACSGKEAFILTPLERLQQAWIQAGYPREYMPRQQFEKVAGHVAEAFSAGAEDFLKAGWLNAKIDFPFAPSHPRYPAMLEAYRKLG